MPQLLYLNKTECAVLATALNATKLSSYPEHQRELVAKIGRRIANFLIDGQTSEDNTTGPRKKLIGFARLRPQDEGLKQLHAELLASIEPFPIVVVNDRPPPPAVLSPEWLEPINATLRAERKPRS